MSVTKNVVIFHAQQEIEALEERAKKINNTINKYKPLVQANNEEAINKLAEEYIRTHQKNIPRTNRERAEHLITLYEQEKTNYEKSAERTRTLVTKLTKDDEILLRELKELNDKLNVCCNQGYDVEICRRLKSLIEKFILTANDSCKGHLNQCKALLK